MNTRSRSNTNEVNITPPTVNNGSAPLFFIDSHGTLPKSKTTPTSTATTSSVASVTPQPQPPAQTHEVVDLMEVDDLPALERPGNQRTTPAPDSTRKSSTPAPAATPGSASPLVQSAQPTPAAAASFNTISDTGISSLHTIRMGVTGNALAKSAHQSKNANDPRTAATMLQQQSVQPVQPTPASSTTSQPPPSPFQPPPGWPFLVPSSTAIQATLSVRPYQPPIYVHDITNGTTSQPGSAAPTPRPTAMTPPSALSSPRMAPTVYTPEQLAQIDKPQSDTPRPGGPLSESRLLPVFTPFKELVTPTKTNPIGLVALSPDTQLNDEVIIEVLKRWLRTAYTPSMDMKSLIVWDQLEKSFYEDTLTWKEFDSKQLMDLFSLAWSKSFPKTIPPKVVSRDSPKICVWIKRRDGLPQPLTTRFATIEELQAQHAKDQPQQPQRPTPSQAQELHPPTPDTTSNNHSSKKRKRDKESAAPVPLASDVAPVVVEESKEEQKEMSQPLLPWPTKPSKSSKKKKKNKKAKEPKEPEPTPEPVIKTRSAKKKEKAAAAAAGVVAPSPTETIDDSESMADIDQSVTKDDQIDDVTSDDEPATDVRPVSSYQAKIDEFTRLSNRMAKKQQSLYQLKAEVLMKQSVIYKKEDKLKALKERLESLENWLQSGENQRHSHKKRKTEKSPSKSRKSSKSSKHHSASPTTTTAEVAMTDVTAASKTAAPSASPLPSSTSRMTVTASASPPAVRSTTPPTIRRGQASDALALSNFARQAFYDAFAKDNSPTDMQNYLTSAFSEDIQRRELTDPNVTVFIAERDHSICGYALMRRNGEIPPCIGPSASPIEIVRMYGIGLGNYLMRRCLRHALWLQSTDVFLGVWERNQRALALYTRYGFVDVGYHTFVLGVDEQIDRIMVQRGVCQISIEEILAPYFPIPAEASTLSIRVHHIVACAPATEEELQYGWSMKQIASILHLTTDQIRPVLDELIRTNKIQATCDPDHFRVKTTSS